MTPLALLLLGVAAMFVVWIVLGLRRITSVSRGPTIPQRSNTALLLIDLQTVFWDHGPYSEAEKETAQAEILGQVDQARAQGHPVIAARQEWSLPATRLIARLAMKGQALADSPGTELARPFHDAADHVLVKRVQDAFETGELDGLLDRLDVGKLQICGLDLNHCVLKTALAARNRGYEVTVHLAGTLSAGPMEAALARLTEAQVSLE